MTDQPTEVCLHEGVVHHHVCQVEYTYKLISSPKSMPTVIDDDMILKNGSRNPNIRGIIINIGHNKR